MSDSDSEDVVVPTPKSAGRPPKAGGPKGPYIPTGKPRGRRPGPPKPPKEPKAPKEKKPKVLAAKPTHAPFTTLVSSAIEALYEKKGVSKIAVVKHIMATEAECADKAKVNKSVKSALKRLVLRGVIVAPKSSLTGKFLLAAKLKKSSSPPKKKKTAASPEKKKKTAPKKNKKKSAASPKKAAASPKKAAASSKKAAASPKKAAASPKKAAASPKKAAAKGRGRPKKVQ